MSKLELIACIAVGMFGFLCAMVLLWAFCRAASLGDEEQDRQLEEARERWGCDGRAPRFPVRLRGVGH